ncbi:MAG: HipA domain-containing protein [Gemmatimonadota bacterium]|nr:HipA domain-containing protein [Gemmatimonadota bacterium]
MTPLDELRSVERAMVLKQGVPAASLQRRTDAVVFEYDDDYVAAGGPPVATTLPVSSDPVTTHAPGALPPFFSGLLPEGRRLSALRMAVKTSADDELTLLLAVGGDTVGDVQIVPKAEDWVSPTPRVTVSEWGEVRFAELLSASIGDSRVDRVALPGVQEKVSARMINVPVARADSRFMLKLDPPEFPHLVMNEAFFIEAARRSGLEAPDAEIVRDADDTPGLLVKRFDRVPKPEGGVAMLAQEDGCQVLARYPADKYRLTTEQVIAGLAGVCRARPVAALALLKQLAFSYLICNGDAHAKNYSVVRTSDEWRVTPVYDVPTSYVYDDHTLALTVNGKRREDIRRVDFLGLGQAVGVRAPAVTRVLDELRERVGLWLDEIDSLPFDEGILRKLRRAIEYRRDRLGGR